MRQSAKYAAIAYSRFSDMPICHMGTLELTVDSRSTALKTDTQKVLLCYHVTTDQTVQHIQSNTLQRRI